VLKVIIGNQEVNLLDVASSFKHYLILVLLTKLFVML